MVKAEIRNLEAITALFAKHLPERVSSGVKVTGEAAAYALVWEWGSSRITKPGPKTVLSVNPNGQPAILTQTAPLGYIRVNHAQYREIVKEEWAKADFSKVKKVNQLLGTVGVVLARAANRCTALIRQTAPIDTGLLRSSIQPAFPGEQILAGTVNEYGPTEFVVDTHARDQWQ